MAESPASAPAAPGIDPRPNSAVKPAYPLGPLPGLRRPDFAMSSPMTQPTTSQVASPILAAEKVAMDEHPETPTDGGAKLGEFFCFAAWHSSRDNSAYFLFWLALTSLFPRHSPVMHCIASQLKWQQGK